MSKEKASNRIMRYRVPAGCEIVRVRDVEPHEYVEEHIITTKDAIYTDEDICWRGSQMVSFRLPEGALPWDYISVDEDEVEIFTDGEI